MPDELLARAEANRYAREPHWEKDRLRDGKARG